MGEETVTTHARQIKKTNSTSLQQKLDTLSTLAAQNEIQPFVQAFVPLDLTPEEITSFVHDLTQAEESDSQWENLKVEIMTIASGEKVTKIEELEEGNRIVFYFEHPVYEGCDREVAFVCTKGEWRAEG